MSKKEIRRAARDAFPKAKAGQARRGSGGAYSKRKRTVSARPASGNNAPKPPSLKRAFLLGLLAAALYFVLIQWVIHLGGSTVYGNILFAVFGLVLFTGANYLSERFRYRRYLNKHKGSDK